MSDNQTTNGTQELGDPDPRSRGAEVPQEPSVGIGSSSTQTTASAPFTVSSRDMETAEQWWSDHFEDPASNEEFSALWILCGLLAQARHEGARDPAPGWRSKWSERAAIVQEDFR